MKRKHCIDSNSDWLKCSPDIRTSTKCIPKWNKVTINIPRHYTFMHILLHVYFNIKVYGILLF